MGLGVVLNNVLCLDVETNGLPKRHNAPTTELTNWPRVVSVAWSIFEDGVEIGSNYHIIAPLGWSIPTEASNVHGITEDYALAVGKDIKAALELLDFDVFTADIIVSHNIDFDIPVLGAEFLRAGFDDPFVKCQLVCTMRSSVNFCHIPFPSGRKGNKFPRLAELHTKLFGVGFDNAHNAVDDVRACYRCYVELQRIGVL